MASLETDFAIPQSLQAELDRLRQLNTLDIQSSWQWSRQEMPVTAVTSDHTKQWPLALLNDRHHVAWERGLQVRWLYQSITVPTHLHGYPLSGLILRLALTWWADSAHIYINRTLVQSGDLFECFTRLCLSSGVTPGETFEVAIRLVSPGHDDGALVRSQLIYELPTSQPTPEPSFIADELTVLATLETSSQTQVQTALSQLNWQSLSGTNTANTNALDIWNNIGDQQLPIVATIHPFQQSLSQLRRTLLPLCAPLKQRTIQCVGHAHLDMAWLWPIADTWNAAERTFKSVLDLQKDFPELTYTHSSPALFEWLEHNRPDLFKKIQHKVEGGSWSIDAGLWIEPEFNIISGEAIARHILYGQRYCQEKFGAISKIAWLPDSFGFCWQLPQLLCLGGIETFATLKLSWNDTTEFPHPLFWWQSPDGSRILSIMLPSIGADIDPIAMTAHAKKWEERTRLAVSLWLPGLGDHGGGPTRDMLEKARRWGKSPFFPQLSFTNPTTYIRNLPLPSSQPDTTEEISRSVEISSAQAAIPVWNDELYLELHRGCYTTHADQKQNNRRCEDLLYQAEVFATIAQITADKPYPKTELESAWKALLFNQFHDILPGTSIPEVFVEADNSWKQVKQIGQQVLDESLNAIALQIQLPPPPHQNAKPVLVFNSLSWSHSSVITLNISEPELNQTSTTWVIYDDRQQHIPCQSAVSSFTEQAAVSLSFLAQNLPAVGYKCFWLCPNTNDKASFQATTQPAKPYRLENEFLKATIEPSTGQIVSLLEKSTSCETFKGPGNQLQVFQDKGQYWDAWNIAPDYAKHPLPAPVFQSIQWIETGNLRQRLQITYQLNQSTIRQIYILDKGTPYLKVETHVDWQETQVLLKVNFPLSVSSDVATYEIPFGAIARSTSPQTEAEKAKWEVPALRWADLGNQSFGVSILTDCKHGFDAGPSHLRLTLLKSPIWPDPTADQGQHKFTYAIYPHPGTWQTALTVQHAQELNLPPIIHTPNKEKAPAIHTAHSSDRSFIKIHNSNILLSTLKPTEENPEEFILRCYEANGIATDLEAETSLPLLGLSSHQADRTDLLENSLAQTNPTHITPWEISTYRLRTEKPS